MKCQLALNNKKCQRDAIFYAKLKFNPDWCKRINLCEKCYLEDIMIMNIHGFRNIIYDVKMMYLPLIRSKK